MTMHSTKLLRTSLLTICMIVVCTNASGAEPVTDDKVQAADRSQGRLALDWFKAAVPLIQSAAWPVAIAVVLVAFRRQLSNAIPFLFRDWQSFKVGGLVELNRRSSSDTKDFVANEEKKHGDKSKVQVDGNPDLFELIAKASSPEMMKSTKVMNTPTGCVVQVSTKELNPNGNIAVAEAVTFVPGIKATITRDSDKKITDVTFDVLQK